MRSRLARGADGVFVYPFTAFRLDHWTAAAVVTAPETAAAAAVLPETNICRERHQDDDENRSSGLVHKAAYQQLNPVAAEKGGRFLC